MKGVRDVHLWRNAFHELNSHVKSVNGMEEKVFQQLQFSYDRLGDEKVKQCFLCCALYPEDYQIYTKDLKKLWIAEGIVEEMDSMIKEFDRGVAILNKLKNSCLIESDISNYGVKLHDVVRDMALRITSVRPRFLVKAGMQLNEIPDVQDWKEDLEKASLMENGKLEIPSQLPPVKCQNLTTLLLSRCFIESLPECFFEQMHELKILDLSANAIKSLPNSISNLETLTTLLLCWCEHLEKVPSVSKLEALKKLDLEETNIKELPHGMERLMNLKYLDLGDTSIREIPHGILGKLTSLRYLAALNLDTLVRGEDIGGLRKLEFFTGRFHDLKELNSYVQALDARIYTPSQYHIRVGDYIHDGGGKSIQINGCDISCTDDDIKVPSDVEELFIYNWIVHLCEEGAFFSGFIPMPLNMFSSLSKIRIYQCKNIKKLFSFNWVLQNLKNLGDLDVGGCDELEEIIASESELEEGGPSAFKFTIPKLLKLGLRHLPKLKSICGANGAIVCDSIEKISIRNCPKLKRIPLNLFLQDDDQPSPPPSLREFRVSPKEWWELVEWDHPNAKSLLEPLVDIG